MKTTVTTTTASFAQMILDYLKVFLTFPIVVLVLGGIVLWLYKKEIRELFPRVSKAGPSGFEFTPEVAAKIQSDIKNINEEQQPLKEAINRVENPALKEELQKAQEKIEDSAQQRAIADNLIIGPDTPRPKYVGLLPRKEEVIALSEELIPVIRSSGVLLTHNQDTFRTLPREVQNNRKMSMLVNFLRTHSWLVYQHGINLMIEATEAALNKITG